MLSHINVGTGVDHSIKELAYLMAEITNFRGDIIFDTTKPEGTPRKLLEVTQLTNLGWRAETDLGIGLKKTYEWFLNNQITYRK